MKNGVKIEIEITDVVKINVVKEDENTNENHNTVSNISKRSDIYETAENPDYSDCAEDEISF